MTLLKKLQEAVEPPTVSPEVRAAMRALEPYYKAIRSALGREFADAFEDKAVAAWGLEVDEAFALGYRTGGQLMLEALSRYSS